MQFTCQTLYNQRALTAMFRGLRKTIQKKSSRFNRIYSGASILLGISVFISTRWMWVRWLDGMIILLLAAILAWGDALDAFFVKKIMSPGTEAVTLSFFQDYYTVEKGNGVSRFDYSGVLALAETEEYIILAVGRKQGELCEKTGLHGGTLEAFRVFLQEKTRKEIVRIGR